MAKDKQDYLVQKITNPEYQFEQTLPNIGEAYLIVVEIDNIAVIQHFGESHNPHKKVADMYIKGGFTVRCVYTGGDILQFMKLRETWNKKPIDEVIGGLEHELLKQ